MKLNVYPLFIFFIVGLGSTSCNKQENLVPSGISAKQSSGISVENVDNIQIQSAVQSYYEVHGNGHVGFSQASGYDLINLKRLSFQGRNNQTFAYAKDFNLTATSQHVLSFTHDEQGRVSSAIAIETVKLNPNEYRVSYSSLSGKVLASVVINMLTRKITSNGLMKFSSGASAIGCISSLYSNSGWASVLLSVATCFDPWLMVIAAGGCSLG